MKKTAKKTAKSPKQKAKKTQKKTKAKESKSSKSVKSGKTKDAEKPAKPSKATKAKASEAPSVKTSSKTDKSKMPSVLQSKAYLELMSHMDMQEKKLNIPKVNLDVGGHIENAISTGVLSLDFVLGGGYAGGRFHVVPGKEGAGKTTIIVTSIANATSQNVPSMLTDAEAALDAGYADRALKRFGYSMKKMMGVYDSTKGIWVEPPMVRIQQINNGEKVFRMIRRTMKAMPDIRRDHNGKYWAVTPILNKDGGVKSESAVEHDGMPQFMFYIDSLAALIPDILDSDDEKSTIGAQALMFTRMLPQVCSLITRKNCILVGINQLRDVIGGFSRPGAPTPTTQPGGNALKFYTEVRTAINPCSPTSAGWKNSSDSFEHVEEQSVFGGIDRYKFTKFKNNKHKAFMPNREGYARIRFMHNSRPGDGYDASFDVFHFLESTGQASKRGSTISLDIQPIKANGKNPMLPLEHQAKKVGWMDFKRAVELPENKHAMFNHCRAQIKSGFAFDLERERVTDKKTVSVESEE